MSELHRLANGECFIYVVSRVFDFAEKIKAEDLEKAVLSGITRAMRECGIIIQKGVPVTFIPFRDTIQKHSETQLVNHGLSLTNKIYFEDIERLHNLFAIVGFFDGLSKDEGVCMELGYAFGISKPIILAITDFVRGAYKNFPLSDHIVDPIIEAMSSKIVYEYKIARTQGTFKEVLLESLAKVLDRIEEEVYLMGIETFMQNRVLGKWHADISSSKYDVYIDFGGGLFEWQRMLQEQLENKFELMGLDCAVSNRYRYLGKSTENVSIEELGWQDIKKAEASTLIITCSDSIEMSSGTAAIQGFCHALGKKILLYDSKLTDIVADDGYRSSRNLMIDYSANEIAESFVEIPKIAEKLLGA